MLPVTRLRDLTQPDEEVSRESFSLPAQLSSVSALRVILGGTLAGFSRLDDVQVVASEFAANAVREYCVCCPHSAIDVAVECGSTGVRLEISYATSTVHNPKWDDETRDAYTYGLAIVRLASDQRGFCAWHEGSAFPCRQMWWALIHGARP